MFTGSWFQKFPEDCQVIGISRYAPRGMAAGYRLYRALAPGEWFKESNPEVYAAKYFGEVLAKLDPQKVVDDINKLAAGKTPVLVCYEKQGGPDWCHRGFVSVWLAETLGLEVTEFNRSSLGSGKRHPMLPPTSWL